MENTGKYYIPVYNALEGHFSNVAVANTKWVRAIKGEKDDKQDAKWVDDLFKLGIVRSSFIPSKDIRVLRELTRYLYKLQSDRFSTLETTVEQRINYISNNFKQFVKQLKSVDLTTEQILELIHPASEKSEASPV